MNLCKISKKITIRKVNLIFTTCAKKWRLSANISVVNMKLIIHYDDQIFCLLLQTKNQKKNSFLFCNLYYILSSIFVLYRFLFDDRNEKFCFFFYFTIYFWRWQVKICNFFNVILMFHMCKYNIKFFTRSYFFAIY